MKVLRIMYLSTLMAFLLVSMVAHAKSLAVESHEKGIGYAIQGKFTKAKEKFENALRIDPHYYSAESLLEITKDVLAKIIKSEMAIHLFRGISNFEQDHYDRAIKYYNQAIKLNPKYAKTNIYRGMAYGSKKQYDRAIRDFNKTLEINQNDPDAYFNMGFTYNKKGQNNRAIRNYTKAIEINPKYANAYYGRGFVYVVKIGNKVKGCADWKKACELGRCNNYNRAKQTGHC